MTEHVRTLEPHVDFALAEATDFLRGDVELLDWPYNQRIG
jgi:hypothetical protein